MTFAYFMLISQLFYFCSNFSFPTNEIPREEWEDKEETSSILQIKKQIQPPQTPPKYWNNVEKLKTALRDKGHGGKHLSEKSLSSK